MKNELKRGPCKGADAAITRHSIATGSRELNHRNATFAFLLALLFWPTAEAGNMVEQIGDLIAPYDSIDQFSAAVLVSKRDRKILERGYGLADREWDIANSVNTRFRIASLTKQFTAALIMQLVDEKKVVLDSPIGHYLQDYPAETGKKVTVHHLLTHSSGIPNYTEDEGTYTKAKVEAHQPEDFVSTFSELPLQFEPGSQYRYSNSGYFLLGLIIERITGASYADAVKSRIFEPLGMKNSGYERPGKLIKWRAQGYVPKSNTPEGNIPEGVEYLKSDHVDLSIVYAAGALYSTVGDLLLWNLALHYGNPIISDQSRRLMMARHIPFAAGASSSYGYGLLIDDFVLEGREQTVEIIGHTGFIDGFITFAYYLPKSDHHVIVLTNIQRNELNLIKVRAGLIDILSNQGGE